MSTTYFHASIGIDMDRHTLLLSADEVYRGWTAGLMPCLRDVFQLVARNEGLTHWTVSKFARPYRWVGQHKELVSYEVGLVTPPARPEWLTVLPVGVEVAA